MKEKIKNICGALLFVCFTAMFIIGSHTDEVTVVFNKAINICLECIGIS